jgi:predicted nucleic acid-binding protein
MAIVVDTNIFLAVVLDEPEKDRIIQLTSETDPIAPEILPYEIGNAVSAMITRKQITQDEALSAQKAASIIPVRLINVDVLSALKLAIECNIYAYDAYFLHCAKSLSHPQIFWMQLGIQDSQLRHRDFLDHLLGYIAGF